MKVFRSDCSATVGVVGYVAAIECNKVHVERPSASTSGGQSRGIEKVAAAPVNAAAAAVGFIDDGLAAPGFKEFLANALNAEPEEQVRQLCNNQYTIYQSTGR